MNELTFSISCFMDFDEDELFPSIIPFGFHQTKENILLWSNQEVRFGIRPFMARNRVNHGYRVAFKGEHVESAQELMKRFLGDFNPQIHGIELNFDVERMQKENIKLAKSANLTEGSLPGIFSKGNVGICCLPDGKINYQIRNRKITLNNLADYMGEIKATHNFLHGEEEHDLFFYAI